MNFFDLSESERNMIRAAVKKRTGVDIKFYKKDFVLRCLYARLRSLGLTAPREYIAVLQSRETESHAFCRKLSIYHSQFVRDPLKYQALKEYILPEIIKIKRTRMQAFPGKKERLPVKPALRIWSAGCAGGEEPYSIAMVVSEVLAKERDAWNVMIYATDINSELIEKARKGIYSPEEIERTGISSYYVKKYFVPAGDGHVAVHDGIRRMISFQRTNLVSDPFVKGVDVLFCRNVLIYFEHETVRRILLGFYDSLSEGGYLILGNSEAIEDYFMCYYRKIKSMKEFFYRKITRGSEEYRESLERQKNVMAGLGIIDDTQQ